MLTAHNLSKSYGIQSILAEVSFSVNPGERVGLIGPNGCGKTTLLRLLTGEEPPDKGHVTLTPSSLRVGYLAQGFEPDPALTVDELIQEITGDPAATEAELTRLAKALAQDLASPELQQQYDNALSKIETTSSRPDLLAILAALGLDELPEELPVGALSGGQKTRLALALVLLGDPQLLLLDEPTNHLDIAMLEWLEAWLADFPGGALIVTHDRTFLDRTVNRVLDLDPETHKLRSYTGNYSDYLEQVLGERSKQLAAYRDQVYEIRRMRQDIARIKQQARSTEKGTTDSSQRRYAKKVARKAKSRERKLERYLNSDERLEKPKPGWQIKLEFEAPEHLGQDVVALETLSVGYPGNEPLLVDLDLYIQAGKRVAFTGPNGSGKTTLLRTIAGRLSPLSGHVRLGSSVKLGYMSQEQELIDLDLSPLEAIQRLAPFNQTETRSFLHYYLFSGDDPLRPARDLSYGERARLALATLVVQGCNLLLLDEPINHLDIPSRERFEQALTQFEGAVLAVVHDRYFIQRFATELWVIENQGIRREILEV
jgi:ATP-binding cassette subfamily F protein 3